MAQPLPESVKIARVGMAFSDIMDGEPFNIKLGPKEVMVLLSLYYSWHGTVGAGKCTMHVGLWRKTDSNPASVYSDSPDMIWGKKDSLQFVTESIQAGSSEHVVFPWPLILIRSPRMLAQKTTYSALFGEMRLYYLLREVSDLDLAQLMVKDHA